MLQKVKEGESRHEMRRCGLVVWSSVSGLVWADRRNLMRRNIHTAGRATGPVVLAATLALLTGAGVARADVGDRNETIKPGYATKQVPVRRRRDGQRLGLTLQRRAKPDMAGLRHRQRQRHNQDGLRPEQLPRRETPDRSRTHRILQQPTERSLAHLRHWTEERNHPGRLRPVQVSALRLFHEHRLPQAMRGAEEAGVASGPTAGPPTACPHTQTCHRWPGTQDTATAQRTPPVSALRPGQPRPGRPRPPGTPP